MQENDPEATPEEDPQAAPEDEPAADDPRPPRAGRGPRYWIPGMRLAVLLLVPVLILTLAVVQLRGDLRPTVAQMIIAAGLSDRAELTIGVLADVPGVGEYDRDLETYSGFDIDIGYLIAADLGFPRSDVRFLPVENENRATMQARDRDDYITVDLVIAAFGASPERAVQPTVTFSAPYLYTEQTVVTSRSHPPVGSLNEAMQLSLCVPATSPWRQPPAKPPTYGSYAECLDGVRSGTFEATIIDAATAAGFVARHHREVAAHDIGLDSTGAWAVNTGGNRYLRELVDFILHRSATDSHDDRWEVAFDKNLGAAKKWMNPQQVAVNTQPHVDDVQIRD